MFLITDAMLLQKINKLEADCMERACSNLRDQFAMRAMSGILSNPACDYNIKDLAKLSCEIADAMMEERKKKC